MPSAQATGSRFRRRKLQDPIEAMQPCQDDTIGRDGQGYQL